MLPAILKNFNVFVEGQGFAGRASSITLPKLSRKMEELMAGGMFGAAEVDQGLEKMECSFELHEWSDTVIRNWGGPAIDGTPLRFMGALEKDDEGGSVTSVQASVRGRIKVLDFGDVKQGDANPLKAEMALTYFRYEQDGRELIEIDVVNMIEKVNGTDRLAAQRAAIGL